MEGHLRHFRARVKPKIAINISNALTAQTLCVRYQESMQWKTYTQNALQVALDKMSYKLYHISSLDIGLNPYDSIIAHTSVIQNSPNCSFFMAAVYFSSIERKMDCGLGLTVAFLQLSAIFLSDKQKT